MRDKLTDIIRIGKVSSINPEKGTAQVTFEDRSDTVTGDLFINVPFTLKDRAYYMPAIGERVRVLFDPEAPSKGCIIGSYYADTRPPPYGDANKAYVNFEDETLIEYDKKLNKLTIRVVADNQTSIDIETASNIKITCKGMMQTNVEKEIEIHCKKDYSLISDAGIHMSAEKDISAFTNSNAMVTINGSASVCIKENAVLDIGGDADINIIKNATLRVNGDTEVQTTGKTNIYSDDDMTVESKKALTLKGKDNSMTL